MNILSLLLCTLILPLSLATKNGVPNDPKICNFLTDHGSKKETTANYEIVLVKGNSVVSCYEPGEYTTVRIRVIQDPLREKKYFMKGLLIGLPKNSLNKKPVIPTGVNKVSVSCPGLNLYGHSRPMYNSELEFQFNFTQVESITFRSTVVFKYDEYIENRQTTFSICEKPTPKPTPTPTISTPTSSNTPSPVPKVSCPICKDEIVGLLCPKASYPYNLSLNHTDSDDKLYTCISKSLLRHYEFPDNCTVQLECKNDSSSFCSMQTVAIDDCSLKITDRFRKFTCTSVHEPSLPAKIMRLKVPVERGSAYKCNSIKLKS